MLALLSPSSLIPSSISSTRFIGKCGSPTDEACSVLRCRRIVVGQLREHTDIQFRQTDGRADGRAASGRGPVGRRRRRCVQLMPAIVRPLIDGRTNAAARSEPFNCRLPAAAVSRTPCPLHPHHSLAHLFSLSARSTYHIIAGDSAPYTHAADSSEYNAACRE